MFNKKIFIGILLPIILVSIALPTTLHLQENKKNNVESEKNRKKI